MKVLCTILSIMLSFACLANGQGRKKGHATAPGRHKVKLNERAQRALGVHVRAQIKLGLTGEKLAAEVHGKIKELHQALAAGKNIEIGVDADDDAKGLGEFVAAQHAAGLKGKDLGKAVSTEAQRRQRLRKQKKEQKGHAHGKGTAHGKNK